MVLLWILVISYKYSDISILIQNLKGFPPIVVERRLVEWMPWFWRRGSERFKPEAYFFWKDFQRKIQSISQTALASKRKNKREICQLLKRQNYQYFTKLNHFQPINRKQHKKMERAKANLTNKLFFEQQKKLI